MSFESALHEQLVRQTVREIRQQHGSLYSLTIYADLREYGRNKPPRFEGYVPDVFAVDSPETCRIIGEAKTPVDFETPRSQQQVAAFLSHLAKCPSSFFYLSVPWVYSARASILLAELADATGAQAVSMTVLQGF